MWIRPFKNRDFVWVWFTRLLNALAFYLISTYLVYYLTDRFSAFKFFGVDLGSPSQAAQVLADRLLSEGVQLGERVGVCLPHGRDLVVALLAVHKAGGGFLPLPADQPKQRLGHILEDSGAQVIIGSWGIGSCPFPSSSIANIRNGSPTTAR